MTEHRGYTPKDVAQLARFQTGTHDEGHLLRGDFPQLPASEFFEQAEVQLRGMERAVTHDVIPNLEKFSGKWHPLGFMVWHLGVNERGESLRLHIWPEGERKTTPGPHIHNHAWNLSSLVLKGQYNDQMFKLTERGVVPEYERVSAKFLRKYQLNYSEGGVDGLATNGECVSADIVEYRRAVRGQVHNIENGRYHVPTIREDITTATLVLDSPELGYNTTVLLDNPPVTRRDARIMVTEEEAIRTKELFYAEEPPGKYPFVDSDTDRGRVIDLSVLRDRKSAQHRPPVRGISEFDDDAS